MDRNFAKSLSLVLKYEGGFSNNPADPGGATNKGITLATYRAFIKKDGSVADLKAITDEEVAQCYRRNYWDAIKGDDLPDGVDFSTLDFAVNSGPSRAAKCLQTVVGVEADGVIGPQTLAAVRAKPPVMVIDGIYTRRLAFLHGLSTWPTFGKGWTSRVNNVRVEATKMHAASGNPDVPEKAPATPPTPPVPQPAPAASPGFLAALISLLASLFARKA